MERRFSSGFPLPVKHRGWAGEGVRPLVTQTSDGLSWEIEWESCTLPCPSDSRARRKLAKIGMEISEITNRPTIRKINDSKGWFLEEINEIDKPPSGLISDERRKTQMTASRNERGWHPFIQ